MGSQGLDPWGSWVPMGSQGMDPWGSWALMGSQGGPYGVCVCRRLPVAWPTGGPWPAMAQRLVVPNAGSTPGAGGPRG